MATPQEQTYGRRDPFSDYEARAREEARTRQEGDGGERSVSSLIGELASETSALLRAEVALARQEVQGNLNTAQRGVKAMGVGAGVLMVAVLALVSAVTLLLAEVIPLWLSALIVGGVLAIAGAIMLVVGKRKASVEGIKPGRTLNSLHDIRSMAHNEQDRAMRKWR
jgi:hypothetical protein